MDTDGVFGIKQSVSREILDAYPQYFQEVRRKFSHELTKNIVEPIIDDGLYHVIKADIMRDETPISVDFYMRLSHSIAKIRHYEIPEFNQLSARIPETAKLACRYCGNVLTLDKRGGCSACGAPAGRSYNG